MHKEKLLFIAYYAPPTQVTGNIRKYHLLTELKPYFDSLFLLTSSNRELICKDPSLQISGINTVVVPTMDLRKLYVLFSKKRQKSPTLSTSFKSSNTFWLFRRISESFPFNLFLDDGGWFYIWEAYKRAKTLIIDQEIDIIFTSYRPTADLIVGMLLKRKFPQLKWVADFRDLPVDPIRKNTLFPIFQHRCYKQLLRKVTLLTTVSKGLATNLGRYHDAIHILPNALPTRAAIDSNPPNEKFTLTYTGSIYPRLQDPRPLLQAIQKLLREQYINKDNFQLIYAGKDSMAWKAWLNKYSLKDLSQDKGLVSYREALQLQQESHLNLLFTWSSIESQGILTAKLGTYLAANRPILVMVNGSKDQEIEDRLLYNLSGKVLYCQHENTEDNIKEYIKGQLRSWQKGNQRQMQWPSLDIINRLSWHYEAQRLIQNPLLQHPTVASIPERSPLEPNNA